MLKRWQKLRKESLFFADAMLMERAKKVMPFLSGLLAGLSSLRTLFCIMIAALWRRTVHETQYSYIFVLVCHDSCRL